MLMLPSSQQQQQQQRLRLPTNNSSFSSSYSKFRRIELMRLLFDLIVSTYPNYGIAAIFMENLHLLCLDCKENIAFLLKNMGLIPIKVLLSLWTITSFQEIFKMISPDKLAANQGMSGAQDNQQIAVDLDRRKVSFIGESATNATALEFSRAAASRHESICSNATAISSNSGVNAAPDIEGPIRPVDLSLKIAKQSQADRGGTIATGVELKATEINQDTMNMYKLQTNSSSRRK